VVQNPARSCIWASGIRRGHGDLALASQGRESTPDTPAPGSSVGCEADKSSTRLETQLQGASPLPIARALPRAAGPRRTTRVRLACVLGSGSVPRVSMARRVRSVRGTCSRDRMDWPQPVESCGRVMLRAYGRLAPWPPSTTPDPPPWQRARAALAKCGAAQPSRASALLASSFGRPPCSPRASYLPAHRGPLKASRQPVPQPMPPPLMPTRPMAARPMPTRPTCLWPTLHRRSGHARQRQRRLPSATSEECNTHHYIQTRGHALPRRWPGRWEGRHLHRVPILARGRCEDVDGSSRSSPLSAPLALARPCKPS